MTTHSEFLILAFSKPIREGALNRNDLGIYNLEKTKNGTQIKRLAIAEKRIYRELDSFVHSC